VVSITPKNEDTLDTELSVGTSILVVYVETNTLRR